MSALTLPRRGQTVRSWLHRPIAYTICGPAMMVAGAVTTIIAPRLLSPADFAAFALLASLIQYIAEFDLGLARLTDRRLSSSLYQPDLMSALLRGRLYLGGVVLFLLVATSPWTGWLTTMAGLAGLALMLCNGPLGLFRAQGKLAAFTLAAVLLQTALSVPRLSGLLIDGVPGSILALVLWYTGCAIVLTKPFLPVLRQPVRFSAVMALLAQSAPLFAYSSTWLLFLLANRWLAWLLTSPTQTGLFAFGANLVNIGVGLVTMVAQAYYPRHLLHPNLVALGRELASLLVLSSLGVLLGGALCLTELAALFPHFAPATAATAAMLVSGVPLALAAWLVPLLIARSARPARGAVTLFGVALVVLALGMWSGRAAGLSGLAWAGLPAAFILLSGQLFMATLAGLLHRMTACWLALSTCVVCLGLAALWGATF